MEGCGGSLHGRVRRHPSHTDGDPIAAIAGVLGARPCSPTSTSVHPSASAMGLAVSPQFHLDLCRRAWGSRGSSRDGRPPQCPLRRPDCSESLAGDARSCSSKLAFLRLAAPYHPGQCQQTARSMFCSSAAAGHALAWKLRQSPRRAWITTRRTRASPPLGTPVGVPSSATSYRISRSATSDIGRRDRPRRPLALGAPMLWLRDPAFRTDSGRCRPRSRASKRTSTTDRRSPTMPRRVPEVRESPRVVKASGLAKGRCGRRLAGRAPCCRPDGPIGVRRGRTHRRQKSDSGQRSGLVDGRIFVLGLPDHSESEMATGPEHRQGALLPRRRRGNSCTVLNARSSSLSSIPSNATASSSRRALRGDHADGRTGPRFNTRFGDPECQAAMARFNADLLSHARVRSTAGSTGVTSPEPRVLLHVLASRGYPGQYPSGFPITGLDDAASYPASHSSTPARVSSPTVPSSRRADAFCQSPPRQIRCPTPSPTTLSFTSRARLCATTPRPYDSICPVAGTARVQSVGLLLALHRCRLSGPIRTPSPASHSRMSTGVRSDGYARKTSPLRSTTEPEVDPMPTASTCTPVELSKVISPSDACPSGSLSEITAAGRPARNTSKSLTPPLSFSDSIDSAPLGSISAHPFSTRLMFRPPAPPDPARESRTIPMSLGSAAVAVETRYLVGSAESCARAVPSMTTRRFPSPIAAYRRHPPSPPNHRSRPNVARPQSDFCQTLLARRLAWSVSATTVAAGLADRPPIVRRVRREVSNRQTLKRGDQPGDSISSLAPSRAVSDATGVNPRVPSAASRWQASGVTPQARRPAGPKVHATRAGRASTTPVPLRHQQRQGVHAPGTVGIGLLNLDEDPSRNHRSKSEARGTLRSGVSDTTVAPPVMAAPPAPHRHQFGQKPDRRARSGITPHPRGAGRGSANRFPISPVLRGADSTPVGQEKVGFGPAVSNSTTRDPTGTAPAVPRPIARR